MNYHLVQDDKFINDFISDIRKKSHKENVFIVDSKKELQFVEPAQNIRWSKEASDLFVKEIIPVLQKGDVVFIHCLEYNYYKIVRALPVFVKLGVFYWGGEFTEFPETVYAKMNYDKLSFQFYLQHLHPLPHYFKLYKNPFNILRHFNRKINFEAANKKMLSEKREALKRIDFLFHWNEMDFKWIKKDVPEFKGQFVYHFYSGGLALYNSDKKKFKTSTVNIWVGNSATIANNHLDAFELLKHLKDHPIQIICPLSYGERVDSIFTKTIISAGKKIFKEKFQPLTEYMSRDAYYDLLNSADVFVANHNRTQGAANVFGCLLMGKKLFMQEDNTLFQLLKHHGVKVFTSKELQQITFGELMAPLDEEQRKYNKNIISEKILSESLKDATIQNFF